ncbi:MAG: protease complex subunit PrcB family protein [Bacteroidota bacterium]
MQIFFKLIGLGILLALFSCKSSKSTQDTPQSVSFRVLQEGAYCGIEEKRNQLITNEAEWTRFWSAFGSNRIPPPEKPAVDFTDSQVGIALMGMRTSGGYRVSVKEMAQSGSTLDVKLLYESPGPNCAVTEALTYPFVLFVVPKVGIDNANFTVEEKVTNCDG